MAKITQDTAKYVPGKTPISTHHGQPIDVNAPAAPVMDQTYDMNAQIPGVDADSYQFDLTGAAPLSWGTSTFHAGTPRRPAQMQDVPAIGLYERNPDATPEDLGRQASTLHEQQLQTSMFQALKTGWRQTMLARAFVDPSERPDFPDNLPAMPADAKKDAILNLPYMPSDEEQDRLLDAHSQQEFNYYQQRFQKSRDVMATAAWNPGSMMLGMMGDYDAALMALGGGIGLAAKGTRAAVVGIDAVRGARLAGYAAKVADMAGGITRFSLGEYTSSRLANAGLSTVRSLALSGVASARGDKSVSMREAAQFALMEGLAGFLMKKAPNGELVPHPDIPPTPAEVRAGAHLDPEMPHLPSPEEEARAMQDTSLTAGTQAPGRLELDAAEAKAIRTRELQVAWDKAHPKEAAARKAGEALQGTTRAARLARQGAAKQKTADAAQAELDNLRQQALKEPLPPPPETPAAPLEDLRSPGLQELDTAPALEPAPNGALGRAVERVFGTGYFSLYDRMRSYGGKLHRLGQMLVSNPIGNIANSATHFARDAYLDLSLKLEPLERELFKATGYGRVQRVLDRAGFNGRVSEIAQSVLEDLRLKAQAHERGLDIPVNADATVERISQLYGKSGFAERALNMMQEAGRTNADSIAHNPFYVPIQYSAEKVLAGIREGRFTEQDVRALLGMQIRQALPKVAQADQLKVADKFYDNMMGRAVGSATRSNHFEGLPIDDLTSAMQEAGIDQAKIDSVLQDALYVKAMGSSEKMLKRRFNWDFGMTYQSPEGRTVALTDLQDSDLPKILERYSRNVSGQYGLGLKGFRNNADVQKAIAEVAQDVLDRTGSETHRKAAQLLAENVFNHLMGRATGEPLPPAVRALNQLAGAMQLRNSGIYQIMETANIAHAVGLKETISHLRQAGLGFKTMEALHSDPEAMKTFAGLLEAKQIAAGRWKPFVTHFEDNVELPHSWAMDAAANIHESGRFFNGLEIVRRKLAQTVTGIVGTEVEKAVAGDAKSISVMARYGLDESLLADMRGQINAGKTFNNMEAWDAPVRARLNAFAMNVADNWNSENRLGDIPAFMQFSTTGKALLPYLNFMGGAFNKLGRKHIQDQGAAGLAVAMLWQLSAGALAENLRNLSAGRQPFDSGKTGYFRKVLENNPAAGWIGYMGQLSSSGGNAAPGVGAVSSVAKAVTDPSVKNTVAAIPLVSIVPGVGALTSLLNDD